MTLLVLVVLVVFWMVVRLVSVNQIASPATVSDVHTSSVHNKELSAYIEDQQAYEAHFVNFASAIKQQDARELSRSLFISALVVLVIGLVVAYLIAKVLMKPVREAYESQERFLQDAAHELRNPLAVMAVALQQHKNKTPNSELVTIFRRQTRRLVAINEDLLFLERKRTDIAEQLNVSELLQDVIEQLSPIAASKDITISSKIQDNIFAKMSAEDYIRITKNIVDNAIKYSPHKTTVTVEQVYEKSSIHLVVRDQGIGIPPSDLKNIGERFFRASNVGERDGTGLGIAIIKKILHRYAGTFSISSDKHGTKVHIRIPT